MGIDIIKIKNMKIAVPVKTDNSIDNHFGHCAYFKVFTVGENNQLISEQIIPSPQGCGCKSNIASELAEMGVTTMLAGGIGEGAINKLALNGISVVRNCSGDSNQLLADFLAGKIKEGGESCAAHHHHHEEGHVCNH
jgi:predicted Fe-Mo cluster-binding NifX family protein